MSVKNHITAFIALILLHQALFGRALDTLSVKTYPNQKSDLLIEAWNRTADGGLVVIANTNGSRRQNSIFVVCPSMQREEPGGVHAWDKRLSGILSLA